MLTFSSTRGWHISLPKASLSDLGEKKANEANFKGCAFNFEGLREHSGAFQIKLPPKCGNHEIALIRPDQQSIRVSKHCILIAIKTITIHLDSNSTSKKCNCEEQNSFTCILIFKLKLIKKKPRGMLFK